jgi:hypothetical protein
MRYGAIYIAHNLRDGDSIFKVGKTERSVEERMSELTSATSNLGMYSAIAHFVVIDVDSAEKACHKRLSRYRVQDNREFFEIPLPRLLKIVAEVTEIYSARDNVPEVGLDEYKDLEQKSAIELLKLARKERNSVDRSWEDALSNATAIVKGWSAHINEKISQAALELVAEKNLLWEIGEFSESKRDHSHDCALCSVMVLSGFTKKPLELWRSGIEGGKYGHLDLSRAIGEPQKSSTGVDNESQFVKWKEYDDGRVGKISVVVRIENTQPYYKERGESPIPKIIIRATPIKYDNYHQNFKEKYHWEKSFTDPDEALEVFLALVVENIKVPQHDVREFSGTYKKHYGESRPKIYDRGKFELGLLED